MVSPSNIRSHTHKLKQLLNEHDTNRHTKVEGEKPTRPQCYIENNTHRKKSGSGKWSSLGNITPIVSAKQSVLETYIQVTLYRWAGYIKNMYMYACTCMHAITISGKWGRGFEWRLWKEGVWQSLKGRKKREKCCNYIAISKKKEKLCNLHESCYVSDKKTHMHSHLIRRITPNVGF